MAPSIAELAPQVTEVSDKVEQLKLNAPGKQDVSSPYPVMTCDLNSNYNKNGPSYPYYLPYFEGGEKWGPTQVYGSSVCISHFVMTENYEQNMSIPA